MILFVFMAGQLFAEDLSGSGASTKMQGEKPSLSNIPGMTYRRSPGVDSVLTYCNDSAQNLLGCTPGELTSEPNMPFYRLIHPDDREPTILHVRQAGRHGNPFEVEYRMLTRDKQFVHVVDRGKVLTDTDGNPEAIEGIVHRIPTHERIGGDDATDTTESRFKNKYDFLTGLPNRHWFLEKVDAEIQTSPEETRASSTSQCLAVLDLDNFQQVNDFFGRDIGDHIIKKIGFAIQENLGESALVGRMSGDRFGLFFSGLTAPELSDSLEDTFGDFSRDFVIDGVEITQAFSLGVAEFPEHADTLGNLVTSANRALERAKSRIDRKIAVFRESDRKRLEAEIDAREQVIRALDEDRIRVFYQPVVDTRSEDPFMYEALMRIEDENGQILGVEEFKEVIQKGKITRRLDRVMIKQAMEQFSDLTGDEDPPLLAVNLFPPSVIDPGCFRDIDRMLGDHDFPRDRFVVEIPETLMLSHRKRATNNIQQAAEKYDLRFALDDFGVGHGSFKSLNSLPLDFLKIDGTFVQDLSSSSVEQKFVEMTAGLSDHMDLSVIGEWIETDRTARLLEDLGVRYHQGYYYAHPAPVESWEDQA